MENNIFIKLKKEKFNPDIEPKLKNKETERGNTRFEMSNLIYNPITGIIPEKINKTSDLVLCKDDTLDKVDIKRLIIEKEKERLNQDSQYKPVQTKVINNNPVSQNQSNKVSSGQDSSSQQVNMKNYIETYEELKRGSQNKTNQQINNKGNNYDNILEGLKDLGIIK
jgi:hypothetical protein